MTGRDNDARCETLQRALEYGAAGFPVFPVHGIVEPAPPEIVERWRAKKIDKKEAQSHAKCACGAAPCKSPGKHPIVSQTEATTDAEQIRAWFKQHPGANVGMMMPPGFVALDFDPYAGDHVEDKLTQLRLQRVPTLEQQSGAGGTHLVFYGAPENLGSTLDSEPGVDLIHAGLRYLVAEPSGHWSGGQYRWANDVEPAELPESLRARVAQGAKPTRPRPKRLVDATPSESVMMPIDFDGNAEDWAVELAARVLPPAVSNDEPGSTEHGHVTLARAACHLKAGLGLDEDTALEILLEEYNERCIPPWGDHELDDFERTVREAGAHATDGYLLVRDDVKNMVARAEARQAQREAKKRPREAERAGDGLGKSLLFSDPDVPLDYLCEDLCLAPSTGKVSLIAGEGGAGKGPIVDHLAICFALGAKAFGVFQCQRVNVLLIDCEGAILTMRRLRRLARGLRRDPSELDGRLHVFDASGADLVSDAYHERLEAFVVAHSIGVVVLDSYTSAMLGSGVEANQPEFAMLAKVLGALGVLVLAVAHANKEASKRNDEPRLSDVAYSGALGAMAQTAIVVWRPDRDDRNTVRVGCARAPEEHFASFGLHFSGAKEDPLTVRLTASAPAPQVAKEQTHLTTVAKRVARIEDALKTDGVIRSYKISEIRATCGLSGDSWGEALAECLRRKSVVREGGQLRYVPPAQRPR